MSAQTKGAKIFLNPYEEHLCGFSWMGFHVKPYVSVYLISVFMSHAYLCEWADMNESSQFVVNELIYICITYNYIIIGNNI